jgi:hypothetical protein
MRLPPETLTIEAEAVEAALGMVHPGEAADHFVVSRIGPLNSSAKRSR